MTPPGSALALRVAGALATLLIALGLAWAALRVYALERAELVFDSEPKTLEQLASARGSTRVSARLAEVRLAQGEQALFELCAADPLHVASWAGAFELVVFRLPGPELLLRVPLDAAHLAQAKRSGGEACVTLGGGEIAAGGVHTLDAVWPERAPSPAQRRVPLRAHVVAHRALGRQERLAIAALAAGVLLLLGTLLLRPRAPAPQDGARASSQPAAAPALGKKSLVLALGAYALLASASFLPLYGSTLGLAKAVFLLGLQALLALAVARGFGHDCASALALERPRKLLPWLAAAVGASVALSVSAKLALALVPSTGEAPIESFVSFPSGMLAFAAIGVLVPLGEELFFRGLLLRAFEPLGLRAAAVLCWLAFVALHVAQSFGNWGALLAIAITGAILTLLRITSGSVLVPALAHVLYNVALSLGALA